MAVSSKKTQPFFRRLHPNRARKNGLCGVDHKQIESSLGKVLTRNRFEYPTHFTVDDLANFRRKKAPAKHIADNLRPLSGKFYYKSEYKKKFRAFVISIDDTIMKWRKKKLKLSDGTPPSTELVNDYRRSEYANNFVQHSMVDRAICVIPVDHLQSVERQLFHSSTENKETYVMFKEARRALLIRRPTNLKLEGEFVDCTESKENYKRFVEVRPSLTCRRTDELRVHFDDENDWLTEKKEMFLEFKNVQRGRLIRRHSNIEFLPQIGGIDAKSSSEYKTCFQYPCRYERRTLVRSMENLRSDGEINFEAEYASNYVDLRVKYPDAVVFRIEQKPRVNSLAGPSTSNKLNSGIRLKETTSDINLTCNSSPEYCKRSYGNSPTQKSKVRKPTPPVNLISPSGIGEHDSELRSQFKLLNVAHKNESSKPRTILKSDAAAKIFTQHPSSFTNLSCKKSQEKSQIDKVSCHARNKSFVVLNTTKQPQKKVNFAKNVEYV